MQLCRQEQAPGSQSLSPTLTLEHLPERRALILGFRAAASASETAEAQVTGLRLPAVVHPPVHVGWHQTDPLLRAAWPERLPRSRGIVSRAACDCCPLVRGSAKSERDSPLSGSVLVKAADPVLLQLAMMARWSFQSAAFEHLTLLRSKRSRLLGRLAEPALRW